MTTKFFDYTFEQVRKLHQELITNHKLMIDGSKAYIYKENENGTVDGAIGFSGGVELILYMIPSEQLLLLFLSSVQSHINNNTIYMTSYTSIDEMEKTLKECE